MKQVLILLGFGVPAALVILAIGGDFSLREPAELPQIPAERSEPPPEPIDGAGQSLVRQRIRNWEYRHYDPELGVFDWFARGLEAIPREEEGEDEYEVVKPEILFSSFTTTTPLLKKTLTRLNAGRGRIRFGARDVSARLKGTVRASSKELFTPRGITEIKLRTDELNILAANRREDADVPAAQFWTESIVHVTGPSFEVISRGGMRGETQLNRMTLRPPVTMHLVTQGEGVFFGRKQPRGAGERRIDIDGKGPLIVERLPEEGIFLMSLSGGVVIRDGDISVESEKLGITLGQGGNVQKAWAVGSVVVRQAGEARLFGEEAKWDTGRGRTVVTGKQGVRFMDGKSSLVARTATLTEDRRTLLLEGGVDAQIRSATSEKDSSSFPRDWRVLCDRAQVSLADEGGRLKAERVLLLPARDERVRVTSADGTYEIKGGTVLWNTATGVVRIGQKPELARGESEWVRSDRIFVSMKEGVTTFEGKVEARFKAGGAAWKFEGGRMVAKFEAPEGRTPAITAVTLTDPAGRVRVDYKGARGARVRLLSGRVTWDASRQAALLDSDEAGEAQRLEHGKDWIEARKIVFEPDSKRALFEGAVHAHLEEVASEPGAPPKGDKKIAEPPFEMDSEKLTVYFDDQYETKETLAEGKVKFTSGKGGLALSCERARYARGEEITFEGEERPELVSAKNKLSADKIIVYLSQGRIVFLEKVIGEFDSEEGAAMTARCEKVIALYDKASGAVAEVYFEGGVHIEVESEKQGRLTADGRRAVYEVQKGLVSLAGEPVVVKQRALVIREEKVVYDLKEEVLFTKPGAKGYDWDIDPSRWRKKKKEK